MHLIESLTCCRAKFLFASVFRLTNMAWHTDVADEERVKKYYMLLEIPFPLYRVKLLLKLYQLKGITSSCLCFVFHLNTPTRIPARVKLK